MRFGIDPNIGIPDQWRQADPRALPQSRSCAWLAGPYRLAEVPNLVARLSGWGCRTLFVIRPSWRAWADCGTRLRHASTFIRWRRAGAS